MASWAPSLEWPTRRHNWMEVASVAPLIWCRGCANPARDSRNLLAELKECERRTLRRVLSLLFSCRWGELGILIPLQIDQVFSPTIERSVWHWQGPYQSGHGLLPEVWLFKFTMEFLIINLKVSINYLHSLGLLNLKVWILCEFKWQFLFSEACLGLPRRRTFSGDSRKT